MSHFVDILRLKTKEDCDELRHLFAVPGNYWLDRGLRLAARQHNLGKADLLLKRVKEEKQPIDVNKADGNGFTPLHVCTARSPDSSDGLGFAKLLLEEFLGQKMHTTSYHHLNSFRKHSSTLYQVQLKQSRLSEGKRLSMPQISWERPR